MLREDDEREEHMKKLIMMACAAAVVLHATCALAGAAAVKLPPYTERTLPNGLRVFIMETREVPLVTAALVVPAGSAADGPGAEGIANLTSRLLMKGAGGMTADEIAEAIEAVGGDMRCGTSRDYSSAYASFMAKDLALAVDMLAKIALSPSFPEEEIAREKSLVAAAIAGAKDNPMALATREFVRALAGEHPYAHPIDGSEKSVNSCARGDIAAFYAAAYVPRGAALAVVGDAHGRARRRRRRFRGSSPKSAPFAACSSSTRPTRRSRRSASGTSPCREARARSILSPCRTPCSGTASRRVSSRRYE